MKGEWREPWRFWSKVEREPSGCWEWKGSKTPNGYGYGWNFDFPDNGERQRCHVHRQSYTLANGPIPTGMQIDHTCRNKLCVNPDHLEAVTQRENLLRAPNTLASQNRAKTVCAKGHAYDAENTRVTGVNDHRYCRQCGRIAQEEWRARNPRRTRS